MTGYTERKRRFFAVIATCVALVVTVLFNGDVWQPQAPSGEPAMATNTPALASLEKLEIKGRAPKTHYDRSEFGNGWSEVEGCDMRNIILKRDLTNVAIGEDCKIVSGVLNDPYTSKTIHFKRGAGSSNDIQIDHVVALSDAWQKGAQQLSFEKRKQLANDPLELLAVDGSANQQKGGSDAASWLPPNKAFRCQYVARQIAIKLKYGLWVTKAEYDAMKSVLSRCPGQGLPSF